MAMHPIPITRFHITRISTTVTLLSRNIYNAHHMFDEMPEREDSTTWNANIRKYCLNSMHKEALSLFLSKRSAVFVPDQLAFAALLKSCTSLSALSLGKSFHGYGLKMNYNESNLVVSKALMNMYAKCGCLPDSRKLFDEMDEKGDPVCWNILLSGYASSRGFTDVMCLFREMLVDEEESRPNAISVCIVLPVCAKLKDLDFGRSVHGYVAKSGLESKTLVGNALLSMYAKCGCVQEDVIRVFRGICCKDVVSWNAVIAGYAENGLFVESFDMFRQMLSSLIEPNNATFSNILPICAFIENESVFYFGKEIHCYVLKRLELAADISVCNALITFYSRIGRLEVAETVFRRISSRDLVSWNSIIAGYASGGECQKSLELFQELLLTGKDIPDSVTVISVLPVCAQLRNLQEGKKIHDYVLGHPELREGTAVGNALITFYAKCNEIKSAFYTFSMIPRKDLISWNSMLDAYSESGCSTQFFDIFHQMLNEGFKPDSITILSVLHVVSCVRQVKEAHGHSLRASIILNSNGPTVGNAILDAYAKYGKMDLAFKIFENLSGKKNVITGNTMISSCISSGSWEEAGVVFDQMFHKDLTTWNLMVRAYAESDCPKNAISLFHELQVTGMKPDMVSVMSVLPVCARLASIHMVRQCHGYIVRSCFEDARLGGTLLDVYSKCGSIVSACKVFHLSLYKDLVTYTALVGGYAMHGLGKKALQVFYGMLELGIKPDHVIITAVLSACSHAGLIDEGLKIFESIDKIHGMKPTMEHYACTVDLFARAGHLRDAYSFIRAMPVQANANVWGTLLGACKIQQEVELGRVVADHLFKVETSNIGNYIVMSNIYAAGAKWEGVKELRTLVKDKDMKKPAGCSWLEVDCERHVFVAGDLFHPERTIIYNTLGILDEQIRKPP